MPEASGLGFTGWRAYLWPVHQHELKKLIPMLLILFLVSFDYNVLRTMKDTLVVTAKSSGAEVIPFIKVWVMFPGSLLMTWLFTRFSNRFTREMVFYLMIGLFLAYFVVFAFYLYPRRDSFHPNDFADALQLSLPLGFKGFIAMVRNWTFTIFYAMSELWSNIILSMLFWGFANQITKLGEARRFYAILGIATNISGVFAGHFSVLASEGNYNPALPFGADAWEQSMMILVLMITAAGVIALGVFRWMHVFVLNNESDEGEAPGKRDMKGRISMRENFKDLFKSNYLICIAIMVIAYNLVINLVEVLWKHEVHALYPSPSDFNLYMNHVMMILSFIATFTSIVLTGNIIRVFGWTFTAMLTPLILLITSVGFFGFFFFKESLHELAMTLFGVSPLAIVVFFGTLQNCVSRGAKYTIYDATKEMAFVPLSLESKVKGKAAIDGVCNRLGKSGGSLIHQSLLITFSSLVASAPYVGGFLFGAIIVWMGATLSLGRQFRELSGEKEAIKVRGAELQAT